MKSSFLPKYEQKIDKISGITTQGRNPDNFLLVFREKWWLHRFILKFTDLYYAAVGITQEGTYYCNTYITLWGLGKWKVQRKLKSFLCWFPWCHLFPKAFFWLKVIKTFLQTFHKTTLFLIDKGHPYMTSFFGILIPTFFYVFWPLKSLPLIKRFFCPTYQA